MKSLVAALSLILISMSCANAAICPQPEFAARAIPELARLINQFRAKNGVGALAVAPALSAAAQGHACTLVAQNQFTHDGNGGPKARMKRAGCRTRYSAENIAMGYSSPDQTMKLWLESPPHRRILLMGRMSLMGIGVAGPKPGQGGGPRWVLDVSAGC